MDAQANPSPSQSPSIQRTPRTRPQKALGLSSTSSNSLSEQNVTQVEPKPNEPKPNEPKTPESVVARQSMAHLRPRQTQLGAASTTYTAAQVQASHQVQARASLPINENTTIDFSKEQGDLLAKKEQHMDEVIDLLMSASLNSLLEGVFLLNADDQRWMYFRLNEQQTQLEYCYVENTKLFQKGSGVSLADAKSLNVMDIAEVTEGEFQGSSSFTLQSKSSSANPVTLTLVPENRTEFVYFFDGLRCLIGMEMETKEMQSALSALTEVKALTSIYSKPPSIPYRPPNYDFITPIL